jgi:hypothetical protein
VRPYLPLVAPIGFAAAWAVLFATIGVPGAIDWKVILLIVVLGTAVLGMLAAPLVRPALREWGLGAGILSAMLAPFGASVTVLALFSYVAGDMAPGWERSETVIAALALQAVALGVVVAGLALQREDRAEASHRRGRWAALAGTLLGVTAVAVHLLAVAHDAV